MRLLFQPKTDRRVRGPSLSPLLVLGLSVIASVALIGACMAMIAPDLDSGPVRVGQAGDGAVVH